ncbi:MAG TPA: PfkB family carbohydrate kinase [Pseudonocardia sp.]|nr:PfkB family carbohydrate kinase [Pseudonocardia sp.]
MAGPAGPAAGGRGAPRVVVVGDVAVDVLVRPARPPVRGADVPAAIRTAAGGAGANTAVWLAHLGAGAMLVARVGDDAAGRAAAAELRASGVEPALAVDPVAPTATVVVLVEGDGERTMLSDRGAAARLSPSDLPDLAGAVHLHVSGYVLLDAGSRPAGLAALAAARAAGLSTSVDPQAAPALTPAFLDDVRGVDLLLPNGAELDALGGPRVVLARVGAVAVTEGAGGASWIDRERRCSVPAAPAVVRDATGAGDAFDAGLLVAWLGGAAPEDALRAGCAAAARAVASPGGRPAGPAGISCR